MTTKRTYGATRALLVIVPFGMIIVGSFTGDGWLSTLGAITLGWVIASALLRKPRTEDLPPLRRFLFALAAPTVAGLVLIAVLLAEPPKYILLPALVVGIVTIYLAFGYLMWWFVRLNSAPADGAAER